MELRRIKPRLKRLKELLEENTYSGDRDESEKSGRKVRLLECFGCISVVSVVI
jgi:Sister chromatid cohesion protein Dcc1